MARPAPDRCRTRPLHLLAGAFNCLAVCQLSKPITEVLEKIFADDTNAWELARSIAKMAQKNPSFATLLLDRLEGKVPQNVDVGSEQGREIRVTIRHIGGGGITSN